MGSQKTPCRWSKSAMVEEAWPTGDSEGVMANKRTHRDKLTFWRVEETQARCWCANWSFDAELAGLSVGQYRRQVIAKEKASHVSSNNFRLPRGGPGSVPTTGGQIAFADVVDGGWVIWSGRRSAAFALRQKLQSSGRARWLIAGAPAWPPV
jgi:hypothetical protein